MKGTSFSKEELLHIDLSGIKDLISYPLQWAINILFHIPVADGVETLSPLPPDSSSFPMVQCIICFADNKHSNI